MWPSSVPSRLSAALRQEDLRRDAAPLARLVSMADKDPLILDFTNGRVFADADLDEYYAMGLDDDEKPADWDDIDLEDMFDLPPELPPLRLPQQAEIAV